MTWRSFGTVSLLRLRSYFVAVPLLLYLTFAVLYRLAANGWQIQCVLVIVLGALALIALPSILAIYFRRIRFAGLPRGRVRLKAITDPRGEAGSRHHPPHRPPRQRRKAFAYLGASLVLFFAFMAFSVTSSQWQEHPLSLVFSSAVSLLAGFSFFFFVMFRRHSQPTADEALQGDPRTPFLYLRSFDDDYDSRWRPMKFLRFYLFPVFMVFDYSLEDRIARFFRRFGPLVAIGSPKEKMPVLGAARVLLDDDHWQAAVLAWMDAAAAIVVLAGHTEWLIWELRQIRERALTQKALLVFPPASRKNAATRLDTVRRAFSGSQWEAALAGVGRPASLRALVLKNDGGVVLVRSRSRSRDMIHVATMVAHYLLQRRNEWDIAESQAQARPGQPA